MYKRYGKFCATDYFTSWVVLGLMIVFALAVFVLKLSAVYVVFPITYSGALIYSIWNPNREYFEIIGDEIHVKKGKKKRKIIIPRECSLVFSPVDICPPLSVRTAVGNRTHILKEKYAVSILMKMNMEEIVRKVHSGYIKQYTTSVVKNVFEEYKYYYSFVCDEVLLNEILKDRNVNILIPKSMFGKIALKKSEMEIYVDSEC